jgi:hypothetical protein
MNVPLAVAGPELSPTCLTSQLFETCLSAWIQYLESTKSKAESASSAGMSAVPADPVNLRLSHVPLSSPSTYPEIQLRLSSDSPISSDWRLAHHSQKRRIAYLMLVLAWHDAGH